MTACKMCGRVHKARGSSYPFGDELVPDEWRQPYRTDPRFSHLDADDEAEGFMLRQYAANGSKGVYKCWRAAFRQWMRNALKFNPKPVIGLERSHKLGNWKEFARQNGLGAKVGESWSEFQARVEGIMKP